MRIRVLAVFVAAVMALSMSVARAEQHGLWVRPVPGELLGEFELGQGRYGPGHRGLDFEAPASAPVLAAVAGTVTFAGTVAGTRYVSVETRDGLSVRYGRFDKISVARGDYVAAGMTIGTVAPGRPSHLHFAVVENGEYVDPATYFSGVEIRLSPLEPPSATDRRVEPDELANIDAAEEFLSALQEMADRAESELAGISNATLESVASIAETVEALTREIEVATDMVERLGDDLTDGVLQGVTAGVSPAYANYQESGGAWKSLRDRLGGLLLTANDVVQTLENLTEEPIFFVEERIASGPVREFLDVVPAFKAATGKLDAALVAVKGAREFVVGQSPAGIASRVLEAVADYERNQRNCTPASMSSERAATSVAPDRVIMAIDGNGSSYDGTRGQVAGLLADIGFDDRQIVQYSYAGHDDGGEPDNYRGRDTQEDLEASAYLLADQLRRLHAARPDVMVDLVGHSQGGVVAAFFLAHIYDANAGDLPQINRAVTLNSPLQGIPAAQLGAFVAATSIGGYIEQISSFAETAGSDGLAIEALMQMAETSLFTHKLTTAADFNGVDLTTVAAANDLLVPAGAANHDAAVNNVIVDAPEDGGMLGAHSATLTDPDARSAVSLALDGRGPLCVGPAEYGAVRLEGELIHSAEQTYAYGIGGLMLYADAKRSASPK